MNVKIINEKRKFEVTSKVGSMDNVKHKPAGGDKKVRVKQLLWSVTQFYSVSFFPSGIIIKNRVFYRRLIKVCRQCLGISVPSAKHLKVSLSLCTSGSKVRGEVEDPWRVSCQLRKLFKGLRPRRGSFWEEQNRPVYSLKGLLICTPAGKSRSFYKKQTELNCFRGQTHL